MNCALISMTAGSPQPFFLLEGSPTFSQTSLSKIMSSTEDLVLVDSLEQKVNRLEEMMQQLLTGQQQLLLGQQALTAQIATQQALAAQIATPAAPGPPGLTVAVIDPPGLTMAPANNDSDGSTDSEEERLLQSKQWQEWLLLPSIWKERVKVADSVV
jgi:hypothetical protein